MTEKQTFSQRRRNRKKVQRKKWRRTQLIIFSSVRTYVHFLASFMSFFFNFFCFLLTQCFLHFLLFLNHVLLFSNFFFSLFFFSVLFSVFFFFSVLFSLNSNKILTIMVQTTIRHFHPPPPLPLPLPL